MTVLENPKVQVDPDLDWVDVCGIGELVPDRGVAVLVAGEAIAIFRCANGELFAVSNLDPFSGASVLSRGIVGSVDDRPVVASPIFKNRFDLVTGVAGDDRSVSLATYDIRVAEGRVEVASVPRSTRSPRSGGSNVDGANVDGASFAES